MKKLKSVILAGGAGTRLRPLTCNMPKPLAPICGSPCIYYILNLLKTHGVDEAYLTLQYKGEEIEKAVENVREMALTCVKEKEPLGTAGALLNLDGLSEDFFVICGDCICDFDLTAAAEFHRSHGGIATMILAKVREPLEYGVAVTDDENCITRFIEKPSWSRAYSDTVNTGIYIFSKKILEFIPKGKPSDFSKDIFPLLMEKGHKIHGYVAEGYWCDIGNISAYTNCNKDVLSGKLNYKPLLSVLADSGSTVLINEKPVFIGKNVTMNNAEIGAFSVIGNNCVLNEGCRVENSVLLDGVTLEEGSSARGCVICSGVTLKKGVSVGEQCVVGELSQVGSSAVISGGAKIYPKNIIPEYTFVKNTVIDGIESLNLEDGKISAAFNQNTDTSLFVKIGAAFAATVKKGIAVGIDVSQKNKELMAPAFALCSGIMSVSSENFDLGPCELNVFSFAIREFGFGGGIFISKENDKLTFYLLESDGMPFGREKERKFEAIFSSGEIEYSREGEFRSFKGYEKIYEKAFKEKLESCPPISAFVYAPDFITEKITTKRKNENSEYIYVMPQRLIVQKNSHEAYDDDLIKCVSAFCCGMTEGEVYIPYSFPSAVDTVAKKYGFKCQRLTFEDTDRAKLFKMTDINYRALYLISFMAKYGVTFAELAKLMPVFTSRRREIEVTAEKASLMKYLSSVKGRELIEGVKIRENGSTVLIIPKKMKNEFTICAESADAETAAELCDFYAKKLKK